MSSPLSKLPLTACKILNRDALPKSQNWRLQSPGHPIDSKERPPRNKSSTYNKYVSGFLACASFFPDFSLAELGSFSMRLCLVLLGPLSCWRIALAFPELVRHGYPNCATCHYSPTGGGVLTEYGRALSKEIVSRWGAENEEQAFYFYKFRKRLALGGDLRALWVEKKTGRETKSLWVPMQADVEAAAESGRFTLVLSAGARPPTAPEAGPLFSRRHYLSYKFSETLTLRGGRFYPAFGIMLPDHAALIRKNLVWDQALETYNLEISKIAEGYDAYATWVLGRPDFTALNRESGLTLSSSLALGGKSKLGASYYYGAGALSSHHIFGPYAILGFTDHFFALMQASGVRTFNSNFDNPQWGGVSYVRLNYELMQGFHVFATQEYSQLDLTNAQTISSQLGVGTQLFPRPHFELRLDVQQRLIAGEASNAVQFLLHYYL